MLDESLFHRCAKSWQYEGIEIIGINGYPVNPSTTKADVRFIKPHGSLNMMQCSNCNGTHINWFTKSQPRGEGERSSNNRRCTRCRSPLPERSDLMNELHLPPLYSKQAIERCKTAMTHAFAWANNVICIGYSFPLHDSYVFKCMDRGLQINHSNEIKVSLVLRSQSKTDALKSHLVNNVPAFKRSDISLIATNFKGFEHL